MTILRSALVIAAVAAANLAAAGAAYTVHGQHAGHHPHPHAAHAHAPDVDDDHGAPVRDAHVHGADVHHQHGPDGHHDEANHRRADIPHRLACTGEIELADCQGLLDFPVAALPGKPSTPNALLAFFAPQAPLRGLPSPFGRTAPCRPLAAPPPRHAHFAAAITNKKITPNCHIDLIFGHHHHDGRTLYNHSHEHHEGQKRPTTPLAAGRTALHSSPLPPPHPPLGVATLTLAPALAQAHVRPVTERTVPLRARFFARDARIRV